MDTNVNLQSTSAIRGVRNFDNFMTLRNRNLLGLDSSPTKRLWFLDSDVSPKASASALPVGSARAMLTTSAPGIQRLKAPDVREQHMATVLKRQREAELIVANGRISNLQSEMASKETLHKRAKIEQEKQTLELKLQLQMASDKEKQASQRLCNVFEKEQGCRTHLVNLTMEYDAAKLAHEKSLSALEREKCALKSQLEEQIRLQREEILTLRSELERVSAESILLKTELQTQEECAKLSNKKLADLRLQVEEMEDAVSQSQKRQEEIEELKRKLSNNEDLKELVPILNGEIAKLKSFAKENKELKEENRILRLKDDNIFLLKEELDDCKKTVELLTKQCAQLPNLQLSCEELKLQLSFWEPLARVVADKNVPGSKQNAVMQEFARMQQQESRLLERVGSLSTENQLLTKVNVGINEQLAKSKEQERKVALASKTADDHIRHLRRKLLLLAKERDMCRQLLDSYEKETTISAAQLDSDRLQRLEIVLSGYKRDNEVLETELLQAREQLQAFGNQKGFEVTIDRDRLEVKVKQLQMENTNLEHRVRQLMEDKQSVELKREIVINQNSALECSLQQLKEEKHIVEMKLEAASNQGDRVTTDHRIVHLISNPVQWVQQQREEHLQTLLKDNEALKQRVKVLEEAEGHVADLTLQVEERLKTAPSPQEIEDLQKKLTSAENKNTRQMEVFKKFSTDFREVTSILLGYNISLPCTNQYKVCNSYAESPDDYFLFSKSEGGELQLLETPYSLAHVENIELYLHTHRSIPAFLSNLTLDLFKMRTSTTDSTMAE